MDESIYCFSYFLSKREYREQLIQALSKLVAPTLAEPGCIQYELLVDHDNPLFLIMLEKFINQSALEFHEQQSYIKNFVENEMHLYCDQTSWHVAGKID